MISQTFAYHVHVTHATCGISETISALIVAWGIVISLFV